jgi:hypothetical protein
MARRKKGGQRLIEMARKRRKSSSKPKANNRLKEQLEEYKARRPKPKRQKGGQKLLTPRKRQTRVAKEDRTGGRYSVTPLPKPKAKAKPKVRKYTPKEKADYKKRYKETARKPDPAFTRTKPKPTKKPVVAPPKGVKATRPGAGLTKRLTTIREKAASSKAARSRTALQTPKGAGRSLRADLTKEQKTLVAEGKKISKKLGLKIPAPSVKRAEQIGLPLEILGWIALAATGKAKAAKTAGSKFSKWKSLFKGKPKPRTPRTPRTPPGGGHTPGAPLGGAGGHAAGAKATADAAKKAKRLRDARRAEQLRKAKQGASQWR